MKKKTGFILAISAFCLLGLGTQVKASSENGACYTQNHYSEWHEEHHQQMQQQRINREYENESLTTTASVISSDDSSEVISCPQGHEWCDGNHQGRASAQTYNDQNENCPRTNNHHNENRHHGGHH